MERYGETKRMKIVPFKRKDGQAEAACLGIAFDVSHRAEVTMCFPSLREAASRHSASVAEQNSRRIVMLCSSYDEHNRYRYGFKLAGRKE